MTSYDDIKSGRAVAPVTAPDANSIPSLIDRATRRLAEAKTSAEVLEAKAAAELALHYAKVTKAANESHADCLRIITRAEIRMAGEIDRGQEAGEIAKAGRKANVPASDNKATMAELGISRQRVNEWRKVAEAGEEKVEEAISEALAEGRAPTKADIHRAAGIVKDRPKSDEDQQFTDLMKAWNAAGQGARERFLAETNLEFIAAPVVAAEATGNDLREPVAAEQGQIIREGDAPRETDCQAGGQSQGDSDASCPDTELPATADQAGRFDSGSLTEIEVKPQVRVLPGDAFEVAKGGPTGMGRSDSLERQAPNSNPLPSSSQVADAPAPTSSPVSAKAGDVPPPASPATNSKPDCLDPGNCKVPFTSALCARCNDARMMRRAAE